MTTPNASFANGHPRALCTMYSYLPAADFNMHAPQGKTMLLDGYCQTLLMNRGMIQKIRNGMINAETGTSMKKVINLLRENGCHTPPFHRLRHQ